MALESTKDSRPLGYCSPRINGSFRFLILFAALFMTGDLLAASFDCGRAESTVEHLICSDSELGKLDEEYASAFQRARSEVADPQNFRRDAKRWISEVRNVCAAKECLRAVYLERIADLERAPVVASAPTTTTPAWVDKAESTSDYQAKDAAVSSLKYTEDQLIAIGVACLLGSVVLLLVLGLTDQVVVFYDSRDAVWSLTPFLFMVAGAMLVATLKPESIEEHLTTPIEKGAALLALFAVLYATYINFRNAIRYNKNTPVGIAIGALRIVVSPAMLVTSISYLQNAFDKKTSKKDAALFLILMALIGLLWLHLINGDRVYEKKGWEPQKL